MSLLLLLTNGPARVYAGGVPPGGFVTGPVIGAAPAPFAARLSLWIIERDGTPVVELVSSFARRFMTALDGTGTGTFSVQADDPDAAEVTYGRLARFFIDGQARMTMLISAIDETEVAQGEEVDQILVVTGPSTFGILDEARVAPGPGSPVDNPGVRTFGLSSPAGTGTVVVNGTPTPGSSIMPGPDPAPWADPVLVIDPPPFPVNFPVEPDTVLDVPVAAWVTAVGSDGPMVYQQTFAVETPDTPTIVDVGATATSTVWVDGVLVAETFGEYQRGIVTAKLDSLDVGDHVLVVKVGEPVLDIEPAVIVRVSELDTEGKTVQSLAHSASPGAPAGPPSSTIGAVRSPTPPVTVTAGAVLAVLIAEAQGRGSFPDLTIGFDGRVDSAGTPWTTVEEITVTVGDDTIAGVAKKLTEAGYGWFRMAPGQLRLDGYATLPAVSVAALTAGVDLTELKHEGTG